MLRSRAPLQSCARFTSWPLVVLGLVLAFAIAARTQSQAFCVFTSFPLSLNLPSVCSALALPSTCITGISPAEINDYGTIVGTAATPFAVNVAFIRWSSGGITFPLGVQQDSALVARNDLGASIGYVGPESGQTPMFLNGTTVTDIQLAVPGVFFVSGINKWNSVVGNYMSSDGLLHGFKRWSNGGFLTLPFPHPSGINDNGTVVGDNVVYHNGQQATLDFPNATQTTLVGISNGGVIIGNATVSGASTAFLYEKGVFKVISVPNSPAHSTNVIGISPKLGLVVGTNSGTSQGFTGVCH